MNHKIPNELYDQKTFFSLGGASTAVWLFTNVLGNILDLEMNNKYKWIGLIIAIFISFLGAIQIKKLNLTVGTMAFFNGLLIFVAASGINAINHGMGSGKQNNDEATILKNMDKMAWWVPEEMVEEIGTLKAQNDSIKIAYTNRIDSIKAACNPTILFTTDTNDIGANASMEEKMTLLSKQIEQLKKDKKSLQNLLARNKSDQSGTSSQMQAEKVQLIRHIDNLKNANTALRNSIKTYNKLGNGKIAGTYAEQQRTLEEINEHVTGLQDYIYLYNQKMDQFKRSLD